MEATEGSFHLDLHSVLADDEHGVALVTVSASRGGRSIKVNAVDVMHLRDGKVTEVWAILPTNMLSTRFWADPVASSRGKSSRCAGALPCLALPGFT